LDFGSKYGTKDDNGIIRMKPDEKLQIVCRIPKETRLGPIVTIRKDGDIVTSTKRAPKRYLGIEWRAYYFASGMKNIHQGNWTCDLEYLNTEKHFQSQSAHFKRKYTPYIFRVRALDSRNIRSLRNI